MFLPRVTIFLEIREFKNVSGSLVITACDALVRT